MIHHQRRPAGQNRNLNAVALKHHQTVPVADIEVFHLPPVAVHNDSAVRHDPVHIQNQHLYLFKLSPYFLFHSSLFTFHSLLFTHHFFTIYHPPFSLQPSPFSLF